MSERIWFEFWKAHSDDPGEARLRRQDFKLGDLVQEKEVNQDTVPALALKGWL